MQHLLALTLLTVMAKPAAPSLKEFEGKWSGTAVIRDLEGNKEDAKVAMVVTSSLGGRFMEARSVVQRKRGRSEVLEIFEVPQSGRELRHWRFTSTGDAFPYEGELAADGKSFVLNRSENTTGSIRVTWKRKSTRLEIEIEMLVGGQTVPLASMNLDKPRARTGY